MPHNMPFKRRIRHASARHTRAQKKGPYAQGRAQGGCRASKTANKKQRNTSNKQQKKHETTKEITV